MLSSTVAVLVSGLHWRFIGVVLLWRCATSATVPVQLAHLVGRWTWCMLVRHPICIFRWVPNLLPLVLCASPPVCGVLPSPSFVLLPCCGTLMSVALSAPVADLVVTSDASSSRWGRVAAVDRTVVESLLLVFLQALLTSLWTSMLLFVSLLARIAKTTAACSSG